MYTNYPNTEQITPKNDPKGSTQHLGELCFSLLAEVLQVRDVMAMMIMWILVLLFAAFCTCEINPRKTDVSIVYRQGSKLTFLLGSTGAPNFKKLGAPQLF